MNSDMEAERSDEGEKHKKKKKRKKMKMTIEYEKPSNPQGLGAPFVGYFPSGFDPVQEEEKVEMVAYQNSKKHRRNQIQVVATPSDLNLDFVGTNYTGEAAEWQPCSHLLGVFDKNTHTLKLVTIAGDRIFRMEPRIRGFDYSDLEGKEVEEAELDDRKGNIQALTTSFGTHKSKLMSKRMEKRRLEEETITEHDKLGDEYEDIGQNTRALTHAEALAKANANSVRNIPPHHPTAETPDKVYLLEDIISQEEWNQESPILQELINAGTSILLATDFQENSNYPLFVRKRIQKLKEQSTAKRDRLAHVFAYMTYLMNFKNIPPRIIKKWLKAGDASEDRYMEGNSQKVPAVTTDKFLKLFTESTENVRPTEKTDLLISYILVLTLIADDFETSVSDIAQDLKMPANDVKLYYLELGCKMRGDKKKQVVYIPLPFTLPVMKEVRRRR